MAIRVLVVDDSAFMRKLISEILNEQPDIEVVSTARNGL
ncbi:MAG: chemotaxis response regulator protein-glutamate methylesterase, partial [Limnochordia bacterium]